MRIVIAPDKFKGALSAAQVAAAIAEGVRCFDPAIDTITCPMADGGEGTVAALIAATSGRLVSVKVVGPRPDMIVDAAYGILGDGKTAVIEMASAGGLALLAGDQRNPLFTTTYGTGEMIRHAVAGGVSRIILGIGGSATIDAGIGALQALGCEIRLEGHAAGGPLVGADLQRVLAISPCPGGLPEILIACDVENPLHGPMGAAAVYGPQKGATPEAVRRLDDDLRQLAQRTGTQSLAEKPGSGAAGGLGFGLCAFLPNARMVPGFDLVAQACGFEKQLAGADLCITGEGRFDRSSMHGKTAVGVARRCRAQGIACIVLAGSAEEDAEKALRDQTGAIVVPIVDGPMELEQAMAETARLLRRAATRALGLYRRRGGDN